MPFFNTEDRAVTIKYLADLRESTPFTALGENYLEQLKATLNYSPILRTRELKLINSNKQTLVEPKEDLFIIHELVEVQLSFFSEVSYPDILLDTRVTEYPFEGYEYNEVGMFVSDDYVSFYATNRIDSSAKTFQMTFTPSKDGKIPLDVPTAQYSMVEKGEELRIPLSEFKSRKIIVNLSTLGSF